MKKFLTNGDIPKTIKYIRSVTENYILQHNIQSLVLGISGGIDSCLTAALMYPVCEKLGIPLIGVSIPSNTNESNEVIRARRAMEAFCHKYIEYDTLDSDFKHISHIIPAHYSVKDINENIESEKRYNIRKGNIKARLRMIYLYDIAYDNKGLVLSTDNYTEYLLGFWTLHGDVGDFGPIQNLWKTDVYNIAEYLANNEYSNDNDKWGVLKHTINAMATDGLGVNAKGDLGQIYPEWEGNSRMGYWHVDTILMKFLDIENSIESIEYKELYTNSIIKRYVSSKFKSKLPYNINIFEN